MKDFSSRFWFRFSRLAGLLHLMAWASTDAAAGEAPSAMGREALKKNPVLLIHGIHDSAASMEGLERWLSKKGWEVHKLSLAPNDGSAPLEVLAKQVADFVHVTFPRQRKFDLVGFSMGGVVSRYYLQRMNGASQVERFVSIAAPNHGTWVAYLINKPGCVQMRPGSGFLRDLNADTRSLQSLRWTTLWTPLDLMILPATSSKMAFGKEVKTWVIAHPLMVLWPGALRDVEAALEEPTMESADWKDGAALGQAAASWPLHGALSPHGV